MRLKTIINNSPIFIMDYLLRIKIRSSVEINYQIVLLQFQMEL
jgi:hypothetical protein